jgi:hypothetical protein
MERVATTVHQINRLAKRRKRRLSHMPLDVSQVYATLKKMSQFFKNHPQKAVEFYYELMLKAGGDVDEKIGIARNWTIPGHEELTAHDIENITTYIKLLEADALVNMEGDENNLAKKKLSTEKEKLFMVPDIDEYLTWSSNVERMLADSKKREMEKAAAGSRDKWTPDQILEHQQKEFQKVLEQEEINKKKDKEKKKMSNIKKRVSMEECVLPDLIVNKSPISGRKTDALSFLDFYDERVVTEDAVTVTGNDVLAHFVHREEEALIQKEKEALEEKFQQYLKQQKSQSELNSLPSLSLPKDNNLHSQSTPVLGKLVISPRYELDARRSSVPSHLSKSSPRKLLRKLSGTLNREGSSLSEACVSEKSGSVDLHSPTKALLIRKLSRLCSRDDIEVKAKPKDSHRRRRSSANGGEDALGSLRRTFSRQLSRMGSISADTRHTAVIVEDDDDDFFA